MKQYSRKQREQFKFSLVLLILMLSLIFLFSESQFRHSKAFAAKSASSNSSVWVLPPLDITHFKPLKFGLIIPGHSPGTVVVTTSNTRFKTGGVKLIYWYPWHRGALWVEGAPNQVYTISMQSNAVLNGWGGTQLLVTDLKSFSVTQGTEGTEGLIAPNGKDKIFIGGTLHVPKKSEIKKGAYIGTVSISINY